MATSHFNAGGLLLVATVGGTSFRYVHCDADGAVIDTHEPGNGFFQTEAPVIGSRIMLCCTEQIDAMDAFTTEITTVRAPELIHGAFREYSPCHQYDPDHFVTLMRVNDSPGDAVCRIWIADENAVPTYESPILAGLGGFTVVNSDIVTIPPERTKLLYLSENTIFQFDLSTETETTWWTSPAPTQELFGLSITRDGSTLYVGDIEGVPGTTHIRRIDVASATQTDEWTTNVTFGAVTARPRGWTLSFDEADLWADSGENGETQRLHRFNLASETQTTLTDPAYNTGWRPSWVAVIEGEPSAGGGRRRAYMTMLG